MVETVEINAVGVLATLEKLASEQERIDELPFNVQQWVKVPDSFPTDFKHAAKQVQEYFREHYEEEGWNEFDKDKIERGYEILQSEECAVAYLKEK